MDLRAIFATCLEELKKQEKELAIAFFQQCDDINLDDTEAMKTLKIEREGITRAEDVIKKVFREYIK